jgi:hypothetical protein
MNYKLNIIEPWESGTESTIDAVLLKKSNNQFLLFTNKIIKVRGQDAQYFVCKIKKEEDQNSFNNQKKGIYEIRMVFDKNIQNVDSELPDLSNYRGNFLSGELII